MHFSMLSVLVRAPGLVVVGRLENIFSTGLLFERGDPEYCDGGSNEKHLPAASLLFEREDLVGVGWHRMRREYSPSGSAKIRRSPFHQRMTRCLVGDLGRNWCVEARSRV